MNITSSIIFNKRFEAISKQIEYNPLWETGVRHFEKAVFPQSEISVKLPKGDEAKCVSPDGRRVIFIGTRMGTFAIFEFDILNKSTNYGCRPAYILKELIQDRDPTEYINGVSLSLGDCQEDNIGNKLGL